MEAAFSFDLSAEAIRPADYLRLVEAVGWSRFVRKESVPTALKNSLYSIVARHRKQVIGVGRLVGDGAIFFYIQDVMVLKEHRKQGVGTAIVAALCEHLRQTAPDHSYVALFTHSRKVGFYERFGFRGPSIALVGMYKGTKAKSSQLQLGKLERRQQQFVLLQENFRACP